eukprot:RCo039250
MEVGDNVTDLEFEEDLQRQPYNLKYWCHYLEFKHAAPPKVRNLLHERALRCLPGSYKLWFQYLQERMAQVQHRCIDDPAWEAVNNTFERALVFMNKMPRIWVEFCQFLLKQYKITQSRQALDRALKSLPITQHDRIWKIYLRFINQDFIPTETAVRCWKRYLQLEPFQVEDFVDYLKQKQKWVEVINCLVRVLNDPDFVSVKGRTKHELWVELCTLLSKQDQDLMLDNNLRTETIIRSGISKFPAEVGQLWCALADFNIRLGRFEVARDVYEEGITSVTTVKDFTQIYDAYAQFEESLLTAKVHALTEEEKTNPEAALSPTEEEDCDPVFRALIEVCEVVLTREEDIDMRASRIDRMFERRQELLNAVLLRQNPHNVHEWMNRVKLFSGSPEKVIATYTEAIATVDPAKAVGKPSQLWIDFARFYESLAVKQTKEGNLREPATDPLKLARLLFEKAVAVNFRGVDELASVWCEYAELEIRLKNYQAAHRVLKRATAVNFTGPPDWKHDPNEPVQSRLWKSVKLWTFYADLDESVGTPKSTSAIYEKIIDLKVATPNIILNYAKFLQEHKFWEESFRAYEKGIALFHWPQVYDLWMAYLTSFLQRYKGTKLERARDLFEQAVKEVPEDHAKKLYLMYAHMEETHGLTKAAMAIYDRAVKAVKAGQKVVIYRHWIKQASEYFGVTSTRTIYEQAIESLPDKYVPEMCIKYAEVELALGEVDRARALYVHCSQFVNPANPVAAPEFWKTWYSFEVTYGNEETFREMLRVRRSVQATFNTSGFVSGGIMGKKAEDAGKADLGGPSGTSQEGAEPAAKGDEEEEDKKRKRVGQDPDLPEVKFSKPMSLEELAKQSSSGTPSKGSDTALMEASDPNAIDIDIDVDDVAEKALPQALFGGLAQHVKADGEAEA